MYDSAKLEACLSISSSPHVCDTMLHALQAADLWSVGVILFAMLIGRYPFSQRESNVARNIASATYTLPDDVQARASLMPCMSTPNVIALLLATSPSPRMPPGQFIYAL